LPLPDRSGSVHGLFTYTIARVLAVHRQPMTYRELVQSVIDRYRAEGFGPSPVFEGAGVDREVFGALAAPSRPTFIFAARPGGGWSLDAGSIHGLTPGSILEAFPPAGDAEAARPIGHVRVVTARAASAVVEPVGFGGVAAPQPEQLTPGARARVRYHEFGPLRLGVALDGSAAPAPRTLVRALDALESLSHGLAAPAADAEWVVRAAGRRVILRRATAGLAADGTSGPAPRHRPTERAFDIGAVDDPALAARLADRLRRIARVRNLAHLSSYVDSAAALQVRLLRWRRGAMRGEPLLAADAEPRVEPGDSLQVVVRNTGTVPLDVTLLYANADYGITPIFPAADALLDNRVDPGQERALDPLAVAAPFGWEFVVALGVSSTPRHENFRALEQESLPAARDDAGVTPLRRLLHEALYGNAITTRSRDEDLGRFAIGLASVHVQPATR
jgi:hypothetical protein